MTKFYLWSSTIIMILARWTIGLTLLSFILQFSPKHGIIISVAWVILQLSEYNLAMTLQNLEKKNE